MKLEVGQFVRTNNGIAKIIDRILEPDHYYFKMWVTDKFLEINDDTEYISEVDVLKASYNIIDLIEVGDYLNGFKVSKIERYDTNTIIKIGNSTFNVLEGEKIYTPSYDNNNGYEKIEKLKSIVTKEQFEQMAYKVGE